jgi:sialic acid synthase SpsE
MIMSTGMASETEIEEAVTAAREAGCQDLVLLHCISSYPAPLDQANLRQIPELAKRFGTLAGLSDHTLGTTASVAAVALGACVIEKHFTLSRADKGPDSEFSLEPANLQRLCHDAKDAWLALGKPGFERQRAEAGSKVFRRSLYFVKDLPAGHVITPEDIRRIRPGMGLAPKYFEQVVGQRLSQAVNRGMPVHRDNLIDSKITGVGSGGEGCLGVGIEW